MLKTLLLFWLFVFSAAQESCQNTVVCFYRNFRSKSLPPEMIPIDLCTHIVYSYAKVIGWNSTMELSNPTDADNYQKLLALKKDNPNLKVLVSIGGSLTDNFSFDMVTYTSTTLETFSQNVVKFVNKYNLDGIDIHWEFPEAKNKIRYSMLTTELRKQLGPIKTITASVSANHQDIMNNYDHINLNRDMDLILVMSINYHGLWEERTGINAPLQSASGNPYNADYSLNLWNRVGIDKKKLILGIPCFGPEWYLKSKKNNEVGDAGTPTYQRMFSEVCVQNSSYTWKYSEKHGGTFGYRGSEWVSMDTPEMVTLKADYVKSQGFGGVAFWEIGEDDHEGACGKGRFPLVRAAQQTLCPSSDVTIPLKSSTPRTAMLSSTSNPSPVVTGQSGKGKFPNCKRVGMFRHKNEPQKFFWCTRMGSPPLILTCPSGTKFNNLTLVCDHIDNVVV